MILAERWTNPILGVNLLLFVQCERVSSIMQMAVNTKNVIAKSSTYIQTKYHFWRCYQPTVNSDEHGLPPAKFFHTHALTCIYPHPHSRIAGPVTRNLRDPQVPKPACTGQHQMKAHENSIFYSVTKCARGLPPQFFTSGNTAAA
jgi:hypothetical protein